MFGWLERGEQFRFLLEAPSPVLVIEEVFRQDLQRDLPLEPRILRPVDVSHAACAEARANLVVAESGPRQVAARSGVWFAHRVRTDCVETAPA